jgi:hypothetical protein
VLLRKDRLDYTPNGEFSSKGLVLSVRQVSLRVGRERQAFHALKPSGKGPEKRTCRDLWIRRLRWCGGGLGNGGRVVILRGNGLLGFDFLER